MAGTTVGGAVICTVGAVVSVAGSVAVMAAAVASTVGSVVTGSSVRAAAAGWQPIMSRVAIIRPINKWCFIRHSLTGDSSSRSFMLGRPRLNVDLAEPEQILVTDRKLVVMRVE